MFTFGMREDQDANLTWTSRNPKSAIEVAGLGRGMVKALFYANCGLAPWDTAPFLPVSGGQCRLTGRNHTFSRLVPSVQDTVNPGPLEDHLSASLPSVICASRRPSGDTSHARVQRYPPCLLMWLTCTALGARDAPAWRLSDRAATSLWL